MNGSLESFAELLTRDEFSVARAALLIAQDAYPELDVGHWMARLDAMADTVRARCAADAFAEQKVVALNRHLYVECGLHGDARAHEGDPRSCYLNDVLEGRRGIALVVAIAYIEIGRKLGLRLQGLAFPGRFLIRLTLNRGILILDPLNGGQPQSEQILRARLKRALQGGHAGAVDLDACLSPLSARDMVVQLLHALRAIHLRAQQPERALQVMQRLLLALPESAEALRDRGLLHAHMECFRAAVSDLQNYLRRRPDAPDAPMIEARLETLRAALARLN